MSTTNGFHDVMCWTDEECRAFLEAQRWPNGPVCPKCGETDPYTITRKSATKNTVRTLYKCRKCRRQFTATIGTIFEDSHIPLNKWFAAIYLMCSSKKGISAHQIHRSLDVTYKSAWFMCHRVREAMTEADPTQLTGVVEADETYVGGKSRRGHPVAYHERRALDLEARGLTAHQHIKGRPHPRSDKAIVFGILERGGRVRSMTVPESTTATLNPIMIRHIDAKSSHLMTDGHPAYKLIRRHLPHSVINHEIEYVRSDVHTQGIENYWSLVKRGVFGVFHHVGEHYLDQYLREFDFRFNRRKISDAERFASLLGQTRGRLTWYCRTAQPENPYA